MRNLACIAALFMMFVLFAGCRKETKPTGSLVDPARSAEVLIFDPERVEPEPDDQPAPVISFVLHPDMRGPSKAVEADALNETTPDDSQLEVRPLVKRIEGGYYILRFAVVNNSNRGGNIIVHFYSYDSTGQMVTARKDLPYLSPKEQWLSEAYFPVGTSQKRWVIKASFRR